MSSVFLNDKVKHESQVTSCKLQATSLQGEGLKAWAEIQKCEFKSTSYEIKSTSANSRVMGSYKQVQTYELQ